LDASAAPIGALLGFEECRRDAGVAKCGLENVHFTIAPNRFLEVVTPIGAKDGCRPIPRADTEPRWLHAAFDRDGPKLRAQALGVRLVKHVDREHYQGYQLHPKDCRATFLEFNHTPGGQALQGPYGAAGVHCQRHVRAEVTRHLRGVEVLSRDAAGITPTRRRSWASATAQNGRHVIKFGEPTITITCALGLTRERLDAMVLVVRGAANILVRARQMGLETREDAFALCGIWMRRREEAE
jgi:hypothetical protein